MIGGVLQLFELIRETQSKSFQEFSSRFLNADSYMRLIYGLVWAKFSLILYSPALSFYTPWKHTFSDVFRGYRKATPGCNGLKLTNTAWEMKFSIKDFLSKCDQICKKLQILSHLLKKFLIENFIFCAVKIQTLTLKWVSNEIYFIFDSQ